MIGRISFLAPTAVGLLGALGYSVPCFKPLKGFRKPFGGLSFSRHKSTGIPVTVPCGQCTGCRLERSRQWAVRCMHEASLHEDNCYLTLTYEDAELPRYGSLCLEDFQRFMKRVRKRFGKVRFFHCGEYGEENLRPHYHAMFFGLDFADKLPSRMSKGFQLFQSPSLNEVWGHGFVEIGSATFESAAYMARYCVKTLQNLRFRSGDRESYLAALEAKYERVDLETGEIIVVDREYVTMSRRPGIGSRWFEEFGAEVFPSDEVIVRGKRAKPPRFYDKLFAASSPKEAALVQERRYLRRSREDETPSRLRVREMCADARLTLNGGRSL